MKTQEEKDLRQAREEFLLESLDFYCKDPVNLIATEVGTGCTYTPNSKPGNKGCMIGRHLSAEQQKIADEDSTNGDTSWCEVVNILEDIPEKLIYLETGFLFQCQNLHDGELHWTSAGLTYEGKQKVSNIIENFKLRKSKFPKKYKA